MIRTKLKKISIDINEGLEEKLFKLFDDLQIDHYFYHNARTSRLHHHNKWFAPWKQAWTLYNEVSKSFWFYSNDENSAIEQHLFSELGLSKPGRGTLKSTFVEVLSNFSLDRNLSHSRSLQSAQTKDELLEDFSELVCIVPRGKADVLNKIILGLGVCAPLSFYGIGNGRRDQLGLLRITIPAEKELVKFIVPKHDAQAITQTIIEECGFDRANQGIVYQQALFKCIPDNLIRIGKHEHAASMEQVINALDSLKGSTIWRTRDYKKHEKIAKKEAHKRLSFVCDEGSSSLLSQLAMEEGAPGATSFRCAYQNLTESIGLGGEITKEYTTMLVPESKEEGIINALTQSELATVGKSVIIEIGALNNFEMLRKFRLD